MLRNQFTFSINSTQNTTGLYIAKNSGDLQVTAISDTFYLLAVFEHNLKQRQILLPIPQLYSCPDGKDRTEPWKHNRRPPQRCGPPG